MRPRGRAWLFAPAAWRALVRADEIWLTVLAACVGALGGVCVVIITRVTLFLHDVLFGLGNGGRLSGLSHLPAIRTLLVLTLGGLAVGLFNALATRVSPRRPVDPIEANALHGGRMSVRDSLILVGQTVLSNGVGASIGLEAGFTQIAAAFGSSVGRAFRARREDLRILLGAGAAGAIGAAFDAPVTGAFYGFELVIGTYSLAVLSPVAAASVAGVGMMQFLGGIPPAVLLSAGKTLAWHDLPSVAVLSVFCALIAIVIMHGVTKTETLFRRLPGPAWLRPMIGGGLVGGLAVYHPSVLSAGHDAMRLVLAGGVAPGLALLLLPCKALASCLSIGSGFRGGLFFASLYLGSLAGAVYSAVLTPYGLAPQAPEICALTGMSAMAVAVIGAPMTMVCLVLELTGSVATGGGVLLAAVLSLLTVRRLFGYSFATWRFHLRGESIRSAIDVGWVRSLNVRSLMSGQVLTVPAALSVEKAQNRFPPNTRKPLILLDDGGAYAGMVDPADLHAAHGLTDGVGTLARLPDMMLTPQMNVREALGLFSRAEADVLVVVEDRSSRQIVGLLNEHYVLRRYAKELERSRRALAGEDDFAA